MSYDSSDNASLTSMQAVLVGFSAGAVSSVINHPFQVLRARFQNQQALKMRNPKAALPPILTYNPQILFRGFLATLLSMWSLTVTQSLAKHLIDPVQKENPYIQLLPPLFGGFASAFLTTPLEGAILRQNRTLVQDKSAVKQGIFEHTRQFYQQHGLRRLYSGGLAIGLRTSIVGSGFSLWTPHVAKQLEQNGISKLTSLTISGMVVGTLFAAISQAPESIRIEQQFGADETTPLSTYQAARSLIKERGLPGLFKGAAYRIPRTAPGIFINAMICKGMEDYFHTQNHGNRMR